ncbi:MAG: fimbrillin family protein [Muribaculaceae bacterium]
MKKVVLSMCVGMAVLAISCSKSTTDEPAPPSPVPDDKKVEIKISPAIDESRATDYGFETGDHIGLYVVNYDGATPGVLANRGNHVDNMRFTYNGTWVPDSPIYWLDDATHADFYLYYPYGQVSSVDAYPFEVRADQSTEAAYKASDLMVGKAVNVAPTSSATRIPVSHVMSRIMLYLEPGNGFTKESLGTADVSVKINGVKCGSTVNLSTGAVTPTGNATVVTPLFADNAYKALIVPQTVAECNLVTVTVDGRDFNLKKGFTFEAAKSHRFTVTLAKTSNGINVGINPWADDGVDNGGTAE